MGSRLRGFVAWTVLIGLLCWPKTLSAQQGVGFAHQVNLTVTNGAVVQLTVPAGTTYCVVSIATAAINWVDDAAAPAVTTTTGIPANAGAIISFSGLLNCINLRMIAQTATSATINAQYFR